MTFAVSGCRAIKRFPRPELHKGMAEKERIPGYFFRLLGERYKDS